MPKNDNRAEDDVTLHILDMHDQGLTPEQIGKVIGMAPRRVRQRIRAVIDDDCAHDPDASNHWHKPRKET